MSRMPLNVSRSGQVLERPGRRVTISKDTAEEKNKGTPKRAVGRPGIDALPTRRLCRTEVAPYESLKYGRYVVLG